MINISDKIVQKIKGHIS